MEMNGGFLVTKIKQLGDRIFEKILSEKNIFSAIFFINNCSFIFLFHQKLV